MLTLGIKNDIYSNDVSIQAVRLKAIISELELSVPKLREEHLSLLDFNRSLAFDVFNFGEQIGDETVKYGGEGFWVKGNEFREVLKTLKATAKDLEKGKLKPSIDKETMALQRNWRELQSLCRDLQVIAIKQLNSINVDEDEVRTIRDIGLTLSRLEFYEGVTNYLAPRDDAPRITEVYHNVNVAVENRWHVASGRPLTLYILYPHKGEDVLCRGGVMTYYEHIDSNRLNNTDWKTKLDSPTPPVRPKWTLPVAPALKQQE